MLLGPRSIAVSHRVVLCIARFPGGSIGAVRVVRETGACSLCPDDSVLGGNDRYTPLRRDVTNALRRRSTATGIPLSPSVPSARQTHWPSSTTTPSSDIAAQTFRVIHPFHPWRDKPFELIAYKSAWGEDRVYFYNEDQQLIALPASWTDVVPADPFVSTAEGRALFRANDLLELAGLVRRLSSKGGDDV